MAKVQTRALARATVQRQPVPRELRNSQTRVRARVPHCSRSEGWGTDGCLKRFGLSNPSPTLSFGKNGAPARLAADVDMKSIVYW